MMNSSTSILPLCVAIYLALMLPSPASAQTGSIIGIIEGPDGLPVSSAVVRIPGTMFGESVDELGRFRIHGLPVGVHTLEILQWGRIRDSVPSVRVTAGDTVVVRHTLARQQLQPEIDVPDRSHEPPSSTPLGFWGGLGLTATPIDPVLSLQAGVRYGFIGIQGSYFNLLNADYYAGSGNVDATPGIDLYLFYTLQSSVAFYLCGGVSFADENLYGFGIGYTVPFNFDTSDGPTIGFGFHTLRGVEVSLGWVNML